MLKRLAIFVALPFALLPSQSNATFPSSGNYGGPKVVTYRTSVGAAFSGTSHSYTSVSLGSAFTGRQVIIGVSAENGNGAINSVSVGATSCNAVSNTASNGGGATAGLFICANATDASATVAVTFASSQESAVIGVWTASGLLSQTAIAGANGNGGASTLSAILSTISGASFVVAQCGQQWSNTLSWTSGVSSDFTTLAGSASRRSGGGHTNSPSSTTVTCGASSTVGNNSMAAAVW